LLLPALLAACAGFSAVNPGASAREVETLMGAPASVWKNADGSEVWEYPRGPFGVETYMVTLGSDRAVRDVRQVLSEAYISKLHLHYPVPVPLLLPLLLAACASFSAITPGASAPKVEARVGAPGGVWKNADGSEVWEYPQGFYAVQTFMVAFDSDHAVREVR